MDAIKTKKETLKINVFEKIWVGMDASRYEQLFSETKNETLKLYFFGEKKKLGRDGC